MEWSIQLKTLVEAFYKDVDVRSIRVSLAQSLSR